MRRFARHTRWLRRPPHLHDRVPALSHIDEAPGRWLSGFAQAQGLDPEGLTRDLRAQLQELRVVIAREGQAGQRMAHTYAAYLRGEAGRVEMAQANAELRRLLALMGMGVLALLPFAFVTLPALMRLADHFHIQLLPPTPEPRAHPRPTPHPQE